jgi:beta-glucosidase
VTLAPGQTRAVSVPVPVAALAYWDVAAHRMTVDPGEYEIMVGSSSADIAAAARLAVTGPAPGPRLILGTDLAAADFDDAENITLVDASRQDGDAVGPAGPGLGRIVFRDVDLGFLGAPGSVTLRVARAEPGTARAELRLGEAGEGGRPGRSGRDELLAEFTVPSTGDRYAWTEVTAELTVPAGVTVPAAAWGVGDLCLVLDGAQRVAWLRVAAPRGAGGPR